MQSPEGPDESLLTNSGADYVASASRAVLGAIPFAGSLLAEIAGSLIPKQRIDRIAQFSIALEARVSKLDAALVRDRLKDEDVTELFEECIRQAARSTSNERREHLASVLSQGLSGDAISATESRHLLRILGEINDTEVIWLRFFLDPRIGGDQEFREMHKSVISPARAQIGSSSEEVDKHALQESYKDHLASVGLLQRKYGFDPKTKQPVIDYLTGGPKLTGYKITSLGRLMLRQIGAVPEVESITVSSEALGSGDVA